jgi:folate-binding protein YgfZ
VNPTATESPLLRRPGAVPPPDGSPDAGVPWHFGDPFAEQRAAVRGAAVVDRSHRGVLAVSGEERLTWLHALTTQHLTGLPDGAGTEALVLDVHGRVEHHAVLAHLDECVWMDNEPGYAEPLLAYLRSMVFWSKVEPRDASDELVVLSVVGPDTASVLAGAGAPVPERPDGVVALPEGGFVRRMPWPDQDAADLLVPRAAQETWWDRLTGAGARAAGSWTFEALRVEALRPRLGVDTDERTIPNEVSWVGPALHLEKGCYRGQETVAKVHNVGRPPRRMVLLHLDGSLEALPETGDPVLAGERTVGRVGSVSRHHELGPIALALLKRSVSAETELVAGKDDRQVPAAVDPDSVPEEHVAPGREAARRLR